VEKVVVAEREWRAKLSMFSLCFLVCFLCKRDDENERISSEGESGHNKEFREVFCDCGSLKYFLFKIIFLFLKYYF
jgi:hypothetical protein